MNDLQLFVLQILIRINGIFLLLS